MKYINYHVNHGLVTRSVPVIFPSLLVHAEMDRLLFVALRRHFSKAVIDPVSAGEIGVSVNYLIGRSATMQLDSNPEDAAMIDTYDYTHGVVT